MRRVSQEIYGVPVIVRAVAAAAALAATAIVAYQVVMAAMWGLRALCALFNPGLPWA